mmetsp:Transcript_42818/g.63522  ORF Transcript_42818/g.63522 Transcript_42818/m.63522 type:complete len:81 (-) Transcript_42818:811-1053(-)
MMHKAPVQSFTERRTPINLAVTSEAPIQRFRSRLVNKTHVEIEPWSKASKEVLRTTKNNIELFTTHRTPFNVAVTSEAPV